MATPVVSNPFSILCVAVLPRESAGLRGDQGMSQTVFIHVMMSFQMPLKGPRRFVTGLTRCLRSCS